MSWRTSEMRSRTAVAVQVDTLSSSSSMLSSNASISERNRSATSSTNKKRHMPGEAFDRSAAARSWSRSIGSRPGGRLRTDTMQARVTTTSISW